MTTPDRKPFFLWRHLNKLRWLSLSLVFAMLLLLPCLHIYQTYTAAYAYDLLSPSEQRFYDVMEALTAHDPRADVLSAAASLLDESGGFEETYSLARHVEGVAVSLLAEYKPGRRLQTNVEFYTALLLHGLGLESELFTPTFAVSRVAGWVAHCFEQLDTGRILRPTSTYVGGVDRAWVPLDVRGETTENDSID